MAEEIDNLESELAAELATDLNKTPPIEMEGDVPTLPDEEPPLSEKELEIQNNKNIINDILVDRDVEAKDQFLIGRDTKFSGKQMNFEKYLTYDSEVYGKLGFNPYRDNEKIYNEKMVHIKVVWMIFTIEILLQLMI